MKYFMIQGGSPDIALAPDFNTAAEASAWAFDRGIAGVAQSAVDYESQPHVLIARTDADIKTAAHEARQQAQTDIVAIHPGFTLESAIAWSQGNLVQLTVDAQAAAAIAIAYLAIVNV